MAYHIESTGDIARAVELAQEAVALARGAPIGVGSAYRVETALTFFADLRLQNLEMAPLAAKTTGLRALEEAATYFKTPAAQLCGEFAEILWLLTCIDARRARGTHCAAGWPCARGQHA